MRGSETLPSWDLDAVFPGFDSDSYRGAKAGALNLAFDPDRAVRQKAYELELSARRGAEIPLAATLNGVKGTASILNSRRGWGDAIDKSLAQARISRKALDALISAYGRFSPHVAALSQGQGESPGGRNPCILRPFFAPRRGRCPSPDRQSGRSLYCTDLPDSGVARVMCNYDGSFFR